LKRIVLLVVVGVVVAAMMAASALSVGAQDTGQSAICAPWSKEWDVSKGWWYFGWYRWCYDPSTSDPNFEESWYIEMGTWEWGDQVNLCPESGTCKMSTG
jgi:Ni/Co efflux regulator RcnB